MDFITFISLPEIKNVLENYLFEYDWVIIRDLLGEYVKPKHLKVAAGYSESISLVEKYLPVDERMEHLSCHWLFRDMPTYTWMRTWASRSEQKNMLDRASILETISLDVFQAILDETPMDILSPAANNYAKLTREQIDIILDTYPNTVIGCFIEDSAQRARYGTINERGRMLYTYLAGKLELKYFADRPRFIPDILYVTDDYTEQLDYFLSRDGDILKCLRAAANKPRAIKHFIDSHPDKVSDEYWALVKRYNIQDIAAEALHLARPPKCYRDINSLKGFELAYRLFPTKTLELTHGERTICCEFIKILAENGARWNMESKELRRGFYEMSGERHKSGKILPDVEVLQTYYYYNVASTRVAREMAAKYTGTHNRIFGYAELGFRVSVAWLRQASTNSPDIYERIYALEQLIDMERARLKK